MKKTFRKILILVIVLAALFAGVNSVFVIKENQYGLVREFGRIERVISKPGLYFKEIGRAHV